MTAKAKIKIRPSLYFVLFLTVVFFLSVFQARQINAFIIYQRVHFKLAPTLADRHIAWGSPVFIRIFKEEKQLEVWLAKGESYELFATYPVCSYSGQLGPKITEGDQQSPEGFYSVPPSAMNVRSAYHLSFDLGFPNAYDREHGRTGKYLMVHGGCVSIGCYAMTDDGIEDIYGLMTAAFNSGEAEIPLHIFPFRLTNENLTSHATSKWAAWWRELKPGYDKFEITKHVPAVTIKDKKYIIEWK